MKRPAGRTGLDLIEESTSLLRSAPAAAFLAYYAGSLPFHLAFLYFLAEMRHAADAHALLGGWSLAMAVLFVAMRVSQSLFCRLLVTEGLGAVREKVPLGVVLLRQLRWQPPSLFALPIAALLTFPYGWAVAFYRNLTVLAAESDAPPRELAARARAQAALWPGQNHSLLLVLFLMGFLGLVNVGAAGLMLPALLKSLLGVETVFTKNPMGLFREPLFYGACFSVTSLLVGPLGLAVYVLRCFYGEAERTGEDLLRVVRRARKAAVAAALLVAALAGSVANAAPPPPPPAVAVAPEKLDRALDRVLAERRFAWRMPREAVRETGLMEDFLSGVGRTFRSFYLRLLKWRKDLARWLDELLGRKPSHRDGDDADGSTLAARTLLYLLLAVVVAAVALFLIRLRRRRRREATATAAAAVPEPDLLADHVHADDRAPEDWLAMGREWAQKGDFRRALRALYLASLAFLSRRELLRLAAHKSNGDYVREVTRRAASLPDVIASFREAAAAFDGAWYGRREVTREVLSAFEATVERLQRATG